jgi:hypothetical protein
LPIWTQPKFGRVIFIDRSLASKRLPKLLERMGFEVELHNTYFVHDEMDDKWIPQVSARQWVILSGDKRLSVEPLNKEAVRASNAQVLLVTDSNSLPEQWAASIIVGRYEIQRLLDKNPGPVFIKIGKQAKDHVHIAKEHLWSRATENTDPVAVDIRGGGDGHSEDQAGADTSEEKAEDKDVGKE